MYEQGHGILAAQRKNSLTWTPVPAVTNALSEAFIKAYDEIEPQGGDPLLIALDVSGSMGAHVYGIDTLTAYECAAALALYWLKARPDVHVVAFDRNLYDPGLHAGMAVQEVLRRIRQVGGGGTDCALPFRWLTEQRLAANLISVSDSESWAGRSHVSEESQRVKGWNPAFRGVNVQTTASGTTLRDPKHDWEMEVVGFNADVPTVAELHLGQAVVIEDAEYSE